MILALALLQVVASSTATTPSPIVVNERLDYYTVSGRDAASLRAALNKSGPIGPDGKHYDAYTKWNLTWHYDDRRDGDGICTLTTRHVVVDAHMTLPQWQSGPDVPETLQRKWVQYLQALRTHEEGHVEIGRTVARALDDLMEHTPAQPDCPALHRELQARAKQILQDHSHQDADYDARTRHGRTQGAVFP